MEISSAIGTRASRETAGPLSSSDGSPDGPGIDPTAANSRVSQASQTEGKSSDDPDTNQHGDQTTASSRMPGSLDEGRSRLVDMSV
jgi:hypothetical protein